MQKAKAIFFLFLFLISQVSFSAELHYCHSELTDVSFAGKAECVCLDTHHDEHNGDCDTHENECGHDEEVIAEDDCCSTQNVEVEQSNELLSNSKLSLDNDLLCVGEFTPIFGAAVSIVDLLPESYIPPLIVSDTRMLIQSFQI